MMHPTTYQRLRTLRISKGFTLIETMIAVSLIAIAIVAPMTLAMQSLQAAYYSRDQITASNLAQEGIEVVRAKRDHNALSIAETGAGDLLDGIPIGQDFYANASDLSTTVCPSGVCPMMTTDGNLYGYTSGDGWTNSSFKRVLHADYVTTTGTGGKDEIRLKVTVTWQTGKLPPKSFSLYEDMYRWVPDSAAHT